MNPDSKIVFIDLLGNQYLIRGVLGNGDCALLALLQSPGFEAPVSGATESRRAIVRYARGELLEACSEVYALVGESNENMFEMYFSQMLNPGFWVGTVAFIWATMAYNINIKTHFFNAKGKPESTSTNDFLRRHIPGYEDIPMEEEKEVHKIYQYHQMKWCKPAMYNHYATMVSVQPMPTKNLVTLNREVEEFNQPRWLNSNATTTNSKAKKPKKKD